MGVEALWVVRFADARIAHQPGSDFGGVVVLETGRLLGGDSGSIYIGTYRVENNEIHVSAEVKVYDPNYVPLFRERHVTAAGSGIISPDLKYIALDLCVPGRPDLPTLTCTLIRVAELP